MIPIRLSARFYGPYRELDWTPTAGITAILGRNNGGEGISSNGAGKTKLLEILPIALFGPRLPWGEYLTLGTVEEKCVVELEFAHADHEYIVTRTFDPRGRGKTTLELLRMFHPAASDEVTSLTRESQAETQAVICDILGMTADTFHQSVFAAQGTQHFADPALTPAQRKAVLSEALGLDRWDTLAGRATTRRRETEAAIVEKRAAVAQRPTPEQIVEADQALVTLVDQRLTLTVLAADAEKALAVAREREQGAVEARHAYAAAVSARDLARAEHLRLHAMVTEASQARAAAQELLPEIQAESTLAAALPEVEALHKQAIGREGDLREAKRLGDLLLQNQSIMAQHKHAIAELQLEIDSHRLELRATCETCGQVLADDTARQRHEASLVEKRTSHEKVVADLEIDSVRIAKEKAEWIASAGPETKPLAEIEQMLTGARKASENLARLEARYEAAGAILARVEQDGLTEAYEAATAALTAAEQALRDTPEPVEATSNIGALEHQLKLHRDQLTMLASSEGAAKQRLEQLEAAVSSTEQAQADLDSAEQSLSDLRYMERMYGRDGIPALLLEAQAIPQIEAEAQRVLRALGTAFRVELRTQRDLKTEERKKETLDVVVFDDAGERSYASFSGGERTRINLALRIGLARLIASRKGTDCRVLCLDEPEFLDVEGLRRLPEVLRSLTEFEMILLITHDEVLADQVDQVVTVVRDGGESRVA